MRAYQKLYGESPLSDAVEPAVLPLGGTALMWAETGRAVGFIEHTDF
jgi:hypothetical protein